ncbi:hypothetical protein amrb99_15060 [Actinomadura sp. RB99]|uniref:hypothetical protein n=1 Tax=Actinomadura sp. RB99 TaxID=2691577 RepID=UPI001682E2E7|nr:hypothetical protein [Actinomadura sp. RB99]MBD2892596.1 hypothetical protein [Actinomadura sp. RB99]
MLTDPFDVCLAVLLAAGLFLALRRLALTVKPALAGRGRSMLASSEPRLRGPPGFGLPVTRLAVLRI